MVAVRSDVTEKLASESDGSDNTITIAITSGLVVVVLIIALMTTIIIVFCLRNQRAKFDLRRERYNNILWFSLLNRDYHNKFIFRANEQPRVLLKQTGSKEIPADKSVEASHEYEMLDKYQQSYEKVQAPHAPSSKSAQRPKQPQISSEYAISQCPAYGSVDQPASTTQPSAGLTDGEQSTMATSASVYEAVCPTGN